MPWLSVPVAPEQAVGFTYPVEQIFSREKNAALDMASDKANRARPNNGLIPCGIDGCTKQYKRNTELKLAKSIFASSSSVLISTNSATASI
jgi:hypothetical protein